MGYSITPLINRGNRKNKSGLYKIQIRLTIDRKSTYLSIDKRVSEKDWSGKHGLWVRESHPQSYVINSRIRDKIASIHKVIDNLDRASHPLALEVVKKYCKRIGDQRCFNDYVDTFMREHRFEKLNTVKKYRTFKTHLDEFNSALPFSALNEKLFQDFAQFLLNKGMMGITVVKYFDPFKKICKHAIKEGYLEKDPFYLVDLGVKPTKSKRIYLELDEVQLLIKAKIPEDRPDLDDARTHWLVCFFI